MKPLKGVAMALKLRQIRNKRGLEQKEVADQLGISVRRYGSWEREERNLNLKDAAMIADVLECTLDELAGRDWPRPAFQDPRQERLNGCYESLNEESKTQVADMVKSIAADPARRIEKDGTDDVDDQVQMGA